MHPAKKTEITTLAAKLIAKEEGYRSKPYFCSEGYPTIGYGQKLGPKNAPLDLYKFELPEIVAHEWLEFSVSVLYGAIEDKKFFFEASVRTERAAVILSMAYQLGINGLMKFGKMIAAIERKDWVEASVQALDSRWAKQTQERAKRHAAILRTGEFPEGF